MFTGIIEQIGEVVEVKSEGTNSHFRVKSPFVQELKIDQSVAHNGVCLTVVEVNDSDYVVTAIEETLKRTNLAEWKPGSKINLERCMPAHGRFDGHIVQGHVDTVAVCEKIEDRSGSWNFTFRLENDPEGMIVKKGSITINGISLTVVSEEENSFSVSIIPYTYEHTNFHTFNIGDKVNIEFDIIGKYVRKMVVK